MPTSHCGQINEIMKLIIDTDPETLLDIGVGFGKYGFLSREYLELWDGRQEYKNWRRKIDGIEAFEKYITPVHDFVYDKMFIGNAIDILPTLNENYDLILLIDVLEHFEYDDGIMVLDECEKLGKNIIISVPNDIGIQGDCFGNIYETHRFQWTRKHFNKFANKFILPGKGFSLIVYIGENSKGISALWKKRKFRKIVVQILDLVHLKKPLKYLVNK